MFAPGIVSTKERREFSGTFTPDGREYYLFRRTDLGTIETYPVLEVDAVLKMVGAK